MDRIFGANGEVGREDFGLGDPKPDIPPTDCLWLAGGRLFGIGGGDPLLFRGVWKLDGEPEFSTAGGVFPPYVELTVEEDCVVGTVSVVPLEPPLLESVLRSVRNEAFDLRRRSFRNEGAIVDLGKGE